MARLGIGIVTYNRIEHLKRLVAAIRAHTRSEHQLVVADDGSTDGTQDWCAAEGIVVVTGPNRGVCWNKNRALYALDACGCDPILLVEDDCLPVRDHWEADWRLSTAVFGHLSYAHPKIGRWLISGAGAPTDPFVNNKATAQCSSVSALALSEVGFFDTRFKGYGVGHAEWTTRLKRAGFGFKNAIDAEGRAVKANLYIDGGLIADDAPTFKDRANVARNELLFAELKNEPIYRNPWSDEEERKRFLAEIRAAGIGDERHERIRADHEAGLPELAIRHSKPYAKALRRLLGNRRSAFKTSGWLPSIALNVPVYDGEIVPVINYTTLDLLKERVRPHWRGLEVGAGYSTVWWRSRLAEVVAVEHDREALDLVTACCGGRPPPILAVEDQTGYAAAIAGAKGPFDLVIANGEPRYGLCPAALGKLSPAGVLLLNGPGPPSPELEDEIAANGFRALSLRGTAPTQIAVQTTTIFYRAGNGLGL